MFNQPPIAATVGVRGYVGKTEVEGRTERPAEGETDSVS